jgi:hypothetical protein
MLHSQPRRLGGGVNAELDEVVGGGGMSALMEFTPNNQPK